MGKTKSSTWQLPETEVDVREYGHTSGHRKKLSVASRAADHRSWHVTLVHVPTGLEVSGEVPEGNYSRKQMQQARERLFSQLWSQLEFKVARHLRIPGR